MHPLDKKLWRDLWRMRAQVLAIALVIGSGVGLMVMALSAQEALRTSTAAYYDRHRFADVFASLTRAPESLAREIAAIPGVQTVETRIVRSAILDIDGFEEPAVGLINSLPEHGQPLLNRLFLRRGHLPSAGSPDEVVLNQPFAEAHGFEPGSKFRAIIDGHRRTLSVVGVALSPEYAYAIGPGALMPDNRRFGVMWMGRKALAATLDLKNAFNSVTLTLIAGADGDAVIARLDALLRPYGGGDAIPRREQISNWFLMNEIDQQAVMAAILPTIFLAVAAFLTNMVMGRLIATERGAIGLFKAFGYSDVAVAWHYAKIALAISLVGVALGSAIGAGLGYWNTVIYAENFSLPYLLFRPSPFSFAAAGFASVASALFGAIFAVRGAIRLPPAEAMRPPEPPVFSRNALSRTRLAAALDQPTRMILRHTLRWPLRSAVTVLGVAMSVAVLISTLQWLDSVDRMVSNQFFDAQRQDVTLGLGEARSSRVLLDLANLPGVRAVEGERALGVVMRAGSREKRAAISGRPAQANLNLVYDAEGGPAPLRDDGLAMSTKLAEILGVGLGDKVRIEVLEGRRPHAEIPVTALFETYLGAPAYMRIGAVNRLMRERPSATSAHLRVDPARMAEFYRALKHTPGVSGLFVRQSAVDMFHETLAKSLFVFIGFFAAFSGALAIGVIYNAAHVSLSERARELATLRVLGFTRFEIAYILLGQSALLVVLALPVGCLAGFGLAALMASSFDTELFRVPLVVTPATYGWASALALAAALISGVLVRRLLDRLDLIAVLKTRE